MEHPVLERPIPREEWTEETGNALWWKFPITEPPYIGSPLDEDFSDEYTHFTSIPVPLFSVAKETCRSSSETPNQANTGKTAGPDKGKHYAALVAKHGTFGEFEKAVWNALGEISVSEAKEAIAKYKQELVDAIKQDLADYGLSVEILLSFVDSRDAAKQAK